MTNKISFGSKSGVTLVELLVVMLIVVILAISLLPVFQKYIIEAQYTAEAVPTVADLRLKTELFRYENQGLAPGLVATDAVDGISFASLVPGLAETYTHTFVTNTPAGAVVAAFSPAGRVYTNAPAEATGATVFSKLNIRAGELTGRRIKPTDVQYQGFANDNGYMYAWGVLGGGSESRLVGGSGFAVLEVVNRATNVNMKIVAEWKKYEEGTTIPGLAQVVMVSSADTDFLAAFPTSSAEWAASGVCYIGDPRFLLSDNLDLVRPALIQLEDAGWTLNVDILAAAP
jgi:prepilin-type N-terminal cleavage/methylation domain-containing protein